MGLKCAPFVEIQSFLALLLEITGNYFREIVHHFRLHRYISILTPPGLVIEGKDTQFSARSSKSVKGRKPTNSNISSQSKKHYPVFSSEVPGLWKNNFLLKKKPKIQNIDESRSRYVMAQEYFGVDAFVPFFPELISCSNLFI